MIDDLIRRSDAIEAECSHCGWRTQCDEDSGYWCESGGLIRRDIPSVDAVPIDDYRSMENTCYKLQKALYDTADRKTENSSEKPNNSTISKMEQVEEPQYDIDKGTIRCDNCAENGSYKCSKCDGEIYFKRLAVKDKPQTERSE